MLSRSRTAYQDSVDQLAGYDSLDDGTRALLRPILRQLAVQQSAMETSWWWYVYAAARVVTALAVVALPVAGTLLLATEDRVAGLIVYALLLGAVAVAYGIQQQQTTPRQLVLVSLLAGAVLAGWAVLTPWRDALDWRAFQVALAATAAGTVLVVLRLLGLVALRDRLIWPLTLRRGGWLLPSQHIAVRLLLLVDALKAAAPTNRHPRFRRNFVRWMDELIVSIEWEVTIVARHLRLGPTAVTDTRQRTRRLGTHLRALQVRLLNEPASDTYADVDAQVADLVARIVRGDWSALPAEPEGTRVPGVLLRFGRRLVTALSLLAVAGALPYLPGISADSGTTGGIQLGLVVAAALSLLPVETTHRDQAFSSFPLSR